MTENRAAENEEMKDEKMPENNAEEGASGEDQCSAPENASQEAPEEAREEKPEEDLQKKYDELSDSRLRLMAEYQNYRRRTEKEKSDIYAHANEEFAKQLLDVIDNFERAMQAQTEDAKYKEGMELIFKQLQGVLEKNSVEEIEAMGKPFDPNLHNAVMNDPASDAESGTVTKVFQKGYMLNKKVIRPAMVAVAE